MGTDGMPMPDLSHLTEDERAKIMEVMNRHKEEEKAEIQMYKSVEKQFGLYIKQVDASSATKPRPGGSSQSAPTPPKTEPKAPTQMPEAALCPLCRKTQLARGCGHKCGFCSTLFCSRCGAKTQVKNDANSSGTVWICNGCRHRPVQSRDQKINDRNIESERQKPSKVEQPARNEERPNLIRQTSEHSERNQQEAKFRINQKPRNDPHKHTAPQPSHTHPHKTTKRSPPLGELADSGIASLSLEDPNCPVNVVGPSSQQPKLEKINQHSYVPIPQGSKTLQSNQTQNQEVELEPKSYTLPSDTRQGKVRPKKRYLPRNPSLGSECGDYLPFEYLQRQKKQLSQNDLRNSPDIYSDCRSEISTGSGAYWDKNDHTCSVSLKLWWENLAESKCEGRLVSAVERVTPLGFYGSGTAPAIRLCLIYPGRGRATRRRTAANAADAIETKEGGWCWTSQTAIGWGPLPKRDLSRLALEISLCDEERNVLSRGLYSMIGLSFDARPRWYKLQPWSRVEDHVRAQGSASRGMMRPRRKLPDLPHSLGRIKGSASHTGNIPMGDSQAHIMAPNYSQLRSGSNTAPSTPPTSVLQPSTSVTGHKYLDWNFNNSNSGSIVHGAKEHHYTPINRRSASANRGAIPNSNSIQIVQRSEPSSKGIPSTSSQPVLLPSNPLLSREPSRESEESSNSTEPNRLLADFVGGLGPGQVAGRQALGAGSLGEVKLQIHEEHRSLIVTVIQAKSLKSPCSTKNLPSPYIKLYLMFGTRLVSKCRTPKASRSLSPSFHHIATFDPAATVAGYDALQVIVWADYGPLDNKVFMGVAQVQLSSLDFSNGAISGWYRLFPKSSIVNPTLSDRLGSGSQLSIDTIG